MNLIETATYIVEHVPFPDAMTRAGVRWLVGRTGRTLAGQPDQDAAFAKAMTSHAIAEHTHSANEQHYELPPAFFGLILGPHRKYSCCLYDRPDMSLADAEARALTETAAHAELADGQRILELGCGWGSLTLFMAAQYPRAAVTAVSNSAPQRLYIESQAKARGLANVTIITADMNEFTPEGGFDRVVSVEMFEHMSNWTSLLARVRHWLAPGGKLFMHIFTHANQPYRFDHADKADWIAQHFFTGGIMPSHGLIRHFPESFRVEQDWRWNGKHYERTALDWLANFDAHTPEIDRILEAVYRQDANLWRRRWRLFFLATAGLFGHGDGEDWAVSHYRLLPT